MCTSYFERLRSLRQLNCNYLDRRDDNSVHLVLHVFCTENTK